MSLAIVAAVTLVLAGGGQPADEGARESEIKDRVQYRQLTREIRELDARYERTVDRAMHEAREAETGEASYETQAGLLALRDERDRKLNRLLLLTLRHGWDMPDFSAEARRAAREAEQGGKREIFAASTAVLRERFSTEAREAARLVRMPVITLKVER